MHSNLHDVKNVEAKEYNGTSWLHVADDKGNHVSLFMPYGLALAMESAFDEHEPEGDLASQMAERERVIRRIRGARA